MTPFIGGNQIQLLRNGNEYFPALEAAIESAKHEIYLQTYIYEADKIGIRLGNALKNAAQRGVKVSLLLDGFGSKDLPAAFVTELESAGAKVLFYRPKISPWTLKKNRLRRMHRQVAVIDAEIGFVGGINIIDDENVPDKTSPRIDYAVRIEGKLIAVILNSVSKLWRRISWAHLHAKNSETTKTELLIKTQKKMPHRKKSGAKAAFVLRDNVLNRRSIEKAYLTAIAQAHTEIIIANAYFVPGRRFRHALMAAAKRGVNVKLLLQGRMEYFLMLASHAYYNIFLKMALRYMNIAKALCIARLQ